MKAKEIIEDLRKKGFDDKEIMDALNSLAAATLGKKGGSVKSEAKAAAARENGRKGGRPKKEK